MITAFIIFAVLSFAEFILVYIKWSELSDLHSIAKAVTTVVGERDRYDALWSKLFSICVQFKWVMYLIIVCLLAVNLLLSIVTALLIHYGIILYHLISAIKW